MARVLHVIHQLALGGGPLSMMASSGLSARRGEFQHDVLSLVPPSDDAVGLAKDHGMGVVTPKSDEDVKKEIFQADIVHVNWWNTPEMYDFLRSDLPAARILVYSHVGGASPPPPGPDRTAG